MNRLSARGIAACLMVLAASQTAANPPDAGNGPPLTLDVAIQRALAGNPELKGFAYELKAVGPRRQQAGLRPAPALRVEVEDVLGTGAARGTERAQVTFALSQVVELGGKRAARLAVTDGQRALLEIEQQARQLDVLAEVARRFVHVASDQEQLRLIRFAVQLGEQTLSATGRRVAAGKAPAVELRRARIALARTEVEHEHAEHELLSSRHQLAAMWGATETDFGPVAADLYALPQPGEFDALVARLAEHPDALRFASEARLRDAEIRLSRTRQRADLALDLGVRRIQSTRDEALVFGLSMPLFGAGRASGAIAEAQALRQRTDAEAEAQRVRVQARLFELHQELRHALTEAEMLSARVLPEMEAALEETRYAYERGRYDFLEWNDARRELLGVRRAYIEAAASAHLYRIEIERLTGIALPAAQDQDPS